jgi:ribosome-binding factor A
MRHQLRSIPQLTFYLDDTLDYVFKIEKLLDDIKKEQGTTGQRPPTTDNNK